MNYLFIFPHPDDESFGPAPLMHRLINEGNNVHLLTLTKGGATSLRHKLGLTIEEMSKIRYKEMICVRNVLKLTTMEVLDLPDGKLAEMDPRIIENTVYGFVSKIQPNIIVTYPVHGVSGFHDHLVTHGVVKRVFIKMKEEKDTEYLKRLAFITMPDTGLSPFQEFGFRIKQSPEELIDCEIEFDDYDIEILKKSLRCYSTYSDKIDESGIIEKVGSKIYFEFWGEDLNPKANKLDWGL